MTGTSFVLRGLRYFRGSYAGVLAGSALGAMVLLGALIAGDSVKGTLRGLAEARVGRAQSVLVGGDRLFRAALADDLAAAGCEAAPVLIGRGAVSDQGSGRAVGEGAGAGGGRAVLEVRAGRRWRGAARRRDRSFGEPAAGGGAGAGGGEPLVLRMEKPGALPLDAPLVGEGRRRWW